MGGCLGREAWMSESEGWGVEGGLRSDGMALSLTGSGCYKLSNGGVLPWPRLFLLT